MYDYVFNFKVDFDIVGVENILVKYIVESKEIKYKWNNFICFIMYLVRKEIINEDEGKMVCLFC